MFEVVCVSFDIQNSTSQVVLKFTHNNRELFAVSNISAIDSSTNLEDYTKGNKYQDFYNEAIQEKINSLNIIDPIA